MHLGKQLQVGKGEKSNMSRARHGMMNSGQDQIRVVQSFCRALDYPSMCISAATGRGRGPEFDHRYHRDELTFVLQCNMSPTECNTEVTKRRLFSYLTHLRYLTNTNNTITFSQTDCRNKLERWMCAQDDE